MTYLFLAIVTIIGVVFLYIPYQRDIRAASQRLARLERELMETACGKIEYAHQGSGYPVLVIHGNAGGFDQGLDLAAEYLGVGFQVIAPSRFGYLGTPLPQGATPQTQAEAFVCLLDQVKVQRVAVIAGSAGGSSAVQLALRHPDRVSALILISTVISDKLGALPPEPVIRGIFGSDFISWLLTTPFRPAMQRMFVPSSYPLTHKEQIEITQLMHRILPIRSRTSGILFDMFVSNADPSLHSSEYPLETLQMPTLIINAKDDPLVNYEEAVAMSMRIPGAKFVTIEKGGHIMVGSGDLVRTEVSNFLGEYAR